MFLGEINLEKNCPVEQDLLCQVYGDNQWKGFKKFTFEWEGFNGTILGDPNLPYIGKESFWVEKEMGLVVFMEGHLYNSTEVFKELGGKGEKPKTPILIGLAFQKWGPFFANKLNGDFAICIFAFKKNQLFFFRDHLGIRPLAVAQTNGTVVFSSDPIGLCKALNKGGIIDPLFMHNFFRQAGYDYEILPCSTVKKVKPGHWMEFSPGKSSMHPYWHPEAIKEEPNLNQDKIKEDLSFLLADAFRIRGDRKFTASAHLSGGLDSGMVACLARQEYSEQTSFFGFSWSPEYGKQNGLNLDERELVKAIAEQGDLIPVFTGLSLTNYLAQMAEWRHPSELVFEMGVVSAARERGVNLIFSGWGGDEFISYGNLGIDSDLILGFHWKTFLQKYSLRKPTVFLSALWYNVLFPSARRKFAKWRSRPEVFRYLKKLPDRNIIPRKKRFPFRSRRTIHLQFLKMGHLESRTGDWYNLGQKYGLEYRFPLLDKRIVEYMLKVPSHSFATSKNPRTLFRELGKTILPENVLKNQSKDDPVKSQAFDEIVRLSKEMLEKEISLFQENPELAFINFDLLKKDIASSKETNGGFKHNYWPVLYCLKTAHEFSKGFKEKNSE